MAESINNQRKSNRGGKREGAGRPAGSPNKLTKTIKEAIEAAFEKVGGDAYLAQMATQQPVAFMSLLGKAMPQQIDAKVQAQIGVLPASVDDFI